MKVLLILMMLWTTSLLAQSGLLLPDLITSPFHLLDNKIDTNTIPGQRLLRFANATPNFGRGKLELRGGEMHSDGTQDVDQIIYKRDGTFISRLAGTFIHHPEHNHTHFNDYANYRLRKVNFIRGLGRVVAESSKISFCIRDSSIAYPLLPGFRLRAGYKTCETTVQGISVGWMDVYSKDLPGQWIDISHLARGRYWLESVVDPFNRIKESNENNNIARVMIYIN